MAQTKENNNKKKVGFIVIGLIAVIAIMLGTLFTFFSDITTGNETITIGSLDIVQTAATLKQNGILVSSIGNQNASLENLNPGDCFVISFSLKNIGSKSAWLRGTLAITGTAVTTGTPPTDFNTYFQVYEGEWTQAQCLAHQTVPNPAMTAAKISLNYASNTLSWADTTPGVINGNKTLPDYEAEEHVTDGGTVPNTTDIYKGGINENEGMFSYTVYFKGAGTSNIWQEKSLNVKYDAQAIQYRNNNSAIDWADLVSTPFGANS